MTDRDRTGQSSPFIFEGDCMSSFYAGWALGDKDRAKLLRLFAPAYPDVIAHHVTYKNPVPSDAKPPQAVKATVVGIADDGKKVQALVVAIDGDTTRPDGSTYHITWSIDRAAGAKPVHSNFVIANQGFRPVDPTPIRLTPRVFAPKSADKPA